MDDLLTPFAYSPECRVAVLGPWDADYMSELSRLPPEAKVGRIWVTGVCIYDIVWPIQC